MSCAEPAVLALLTQMAPVAQSTACTAAGVELCSSAAAAPCCMRGDLHSSTLRSVHCCCAVPATCFAISAACLVVWQDCQLARTSWSWWRFGVTQPRSNSPAAAAVVAVCKPIGAARLTVMQCARRPSCGSVCMLTAWCGLSWSASSTPYRYVCVCWIMCISHVRHMPGTARQVTLVLSGFFLFHAKWHRCHCFKAVAGLHTV